MLHIPPGPDIAHFCLTKLCTNCVGFTGFYLYLPSSPEYHNLAITLEWCALTTSCVFELNQFTKKNVFFCNLSSRRSGSRTSEANRSASARCRPWSAKAVTRSCPWGPAVTGWTVRAASPPSPSTGAVPRTIWWTTFPPSLSLLSVWETGELSDKKSGEQFSLGWEYSSSNSSSIQAAATADLSCIMAAARSAPTAAVSKQQQQQ